MINHHNFKRSENFPHFYHFAVGVVKHGYRSLALEIIHTLAPARCQPAAAERRPPSSSAGLVESIFDAVISADRCTRWEEVRGWELSTDHSICSGHGDVTLGSICFPRGGCAQRHSEGLVQPLMFLFPEQQQQRATGVWGLEILTFVTLFRPVFHSMNYIWSCSSIRDTSVAACQYIPQRCRIINPSCHSQGFPIWLAATLKVIAYSPPLGPQMRARQGEITHWLTTWLTAALRLRLDP